MAELFTLLAPFFWSIKNDITRFSRSFYRKILSYAASSSLFIFLITKLLNLGMAKLQSLSADVFQILLVKGYSLVFLIIVFIQILNGIVVSLNTFYHSKDLEILFVSPVNRTSLFLSKLIETHIKASWMLVIFGLPLLISVGTLYKTNLYYYLYAMVLFVAFSIILVNIGTGITIFIASFFQARKLKKVMISAGIIATVLLLTLLRLFRPERFVNPEFFANLTLFISELKTPSFILLPNRWLSESIFDFLGKTFSSNTVIFVSLLFLTSYITTLLSQAIFNRYHYRGWGLLQEGSVTLKRGGRNITRTDSLQRMAPHSKIFQFLSSLFGIKSSMLIKKEILCQIRDSRNVQQLLIVFSLIIIYLFSIASLPLNWEDYAVQLKYIVSFFNLGLILVIISALCSRIIYPAIVSEGVSLWLIKTSPLTPKRYVCTKFLFYLLPISILGQLLIIFSSYFIGVGKAFILFNSITILFSCFSLVSIVIIFGISDLKYGLKESQIEQFRTSSTGQMIVSIFFILFTLALETAPVLLYALKEMKQGSFSQKAWFAIGAATLILLVINLLVTAFSLRRSINTIDTLESV